MTKARFDFDFLVIGGGSAGVRASRVAAGLGARVAVCEEARLGGTCVNVGCVPKKLMVMGAHFADEWRAARAFGWNVSPPTADWAALIANKDREISRLNGVYQKLLENKSVTIVPGRATLSGAHEVSVAMPGGATRKITSEKILVAVGGEPVRPAIPGAEHIAISDDVFAWQSLPERVLVAGAGYIAVEFAGIFSGYGAAVSLVHRGGALLRGFDEDVRRHLATEMQKKGVDLRFRRSITSVERMAADTLRATFDDGTTLEVGAILAAIGRRPRTRGLGLEAVGVAMDDAGGVRVDRRFRTSVPSIHAVGDVIDRVALTPVALAEGELVAHHLFGQDRGDLDYDFIPSAVFSNPSVGTVGLTSDEACDDFGSIDVYRSVFTPMKYALSGTGEKALLKVVCVRETGRVVGVHIVGPEAGEIAQGFAVALRCGVTKAQLDRTIGIHPTIAEELVTMREKSDTLDARPGPEVQLEHVEPPKRKRILHHRWEDDATRG